MRNNNKGFTIIELVIVIAVIAILAGVMIPTFASVTDKAKESAARQQVEAAESILLALEDADLDADATYYFIHNEDGKARWYTYDLNRQIVAVDEDDMPTANVAAGDVVYAENANALVLVEGDTPAENTYVLTIPDTLTDFEVTEVSDLESVIIWKKAN